MPPTYTVGLLLEVAPGFRDTAQRQLLEIPGVLAVARARLDNRLRVQVTATDPHLLRSRIDGEVKRVPGVHRCTRLAGDGSRPWTPMRC